MAIVGFTDAVARMHLVLGSLDSSGARRLLRRVGTRVIRLYSEMDSAGQLCLVEAVSAATQLNPLAVGNQAGFMTTSWSDVLRAGRDNSTEGADALARLCKTYWYPLYAYLRGKGYSKPDAEDLVQGLFAQLLSRKSLQRAEPRRGRFRSYLLGAMNYFLADQKEFSEAGKRGGGYQVISLDAASAEERYQLEPVDERDPEQLYHRRWALTVLDTVLDHLEQEYRVAGKHALFGRLQASLLGDHDAGTYAAIGLELGLSQAAAKMAGLRLRKRYREIVRELIADTVTDSCEVEEELRFLFAATSQ